jgi:hypothetical protein
MPKKIYESKIIEDAAKRFRMLCEYSFNITEDDGEETPETPEMPEEPDANGMTTTDTPNVDMNADPMKNGENMEQNLPGDEMSGDEIGDEIGGENGAPGFNPTEDAGLNGEDNVDMNTEPMQDNDEVIDVDELTKSQEDTEEKVEDIHISMEKGFDKLLNVVSKLDKMIDASTANMEQIKQEIEKRNPTPLEKLNMRAANDSYPFNVSPKDYWKEKEISSNYRIGGDDNNDDAEQYVITQGDIDKISDYRTISKELNDSEFNQNLLNIFGLK